MSLEDRRDERLAMVAQQLAGRGICDTRVLEAMRAVPRELFLPSGNREDAYSDRALAVGYGQTISQPYIVGLMTEALRIGPTHRVLEVGTGTGYQTAVLVLLALHVYSIERIAELSETAQERVRETGLNNATFRVGDGSMGWPEEAPFDRILVTAAAPNVPAALVDQLTERGRMVLPTGEDGAQQLVCVERRDGRVLERPMLAVRFVRLIGACGFAN